MNYSTAIFLLSDKARAALVSYEPAGNGCKPETTLYKTLNPDIHAGDYVVVPTDTRHGMTVCKVEEIDVDPDIETSANVEWIIGVVNSADFEEIKQQENDAIAQIKSAEKRRKRDELREALLADAGDELKALPIYTADEETTEA